MVRYKEIDSRYENDVSYEPIWVEMTQEEIDSLHDTETYTVMNGKKYADVDEAADDAETQGLETATIDVYYASDDAFCKEITISADEEYAFILYYPCEVTDYIGENNKHYILYKRIDDLDVYYYPTYEIALNTLLKRGVAGNYEIKETLQDVSQFYSEANLPSHKIIIENCQK